MIQAHALLVAAALTVTVPPALAAPNLTCDQVRDQARHYTRAQIRALAKRAKLTAQQWAQVQACLPEDKK